MQNLVNEIKQYLNYLCQILSDIEETLKTSPSGSLVIHKRYGHFCYYHCDKNVAPRYVSLSKTSEICPLAQKRYNLAVLQVLKNKIKALEKCAKLLNQGDILVELTSIYEAFPAELKNLIKPYFDYDREYARKWQARKYKKSSRRVETDFWTKRGELVRSKSELIIANKLYDAGIPYHYETLFHMRDEAYFYPDFLVLNPRTKKEYYWEHFGRLGESVYLNDSFDKLEAYAKFGFFPGVNLLATFESDKHGLSTLYVDWTIKKFLT